MPQTHQYTLQLEWTGNTGTGTSGYRNYARSHSISAKGKPAILCSSDPAFRGDAASYNPEEMLVASLSSCHMLWFLHLCADAGIVVTAYTDSATGTMEETADGGGHFTEVMLNPVITITDTALCEKANQLHHEAHRLCFIARSVNFAVKHNPVCRVERE